MTLDEVMNLIEVYTPKAFYLRSAIEQYASEQVAVARGDYGLTVDDCKKIAADHRAAMLAYAAERVAAETERCAVICDNCHTTQGAAERIRARSNP